MVGFIHSYYVLTASISVAAVIAGIVWSGIRWFKKRAVAAGRLERSGLFKEVQRISRFQYTNAIHFLQSLSMNAANETEVFASSLTLPECINRPALLLPNSRRAVKEKRYASGITKIFKLRDYIKYQYDGLKEYLLYYRTEAKLHETTYYENLIELCKMHDDLGKYMHNKNFDKINGAEWYQGYFTIFSTWFKNGAVRDVETTYINIVQKIMALNKVYNFVPFVIQTTACSLYCDMAYRNLLALNKQLETKTTRYAYYCKCSYKIARLIMQKESSMKKTEPEARTHPSGVQQNTPVTRLEEVGSADTAVVEETDKPNYLSYAWFAAIPVAILAILYFAYPIISWYNHSDVNLHEGRSIRPAKTTVIDTPASTLNIAVVDSTNDTIAFSILFDADAKSRSLIYGIDISKYQGSLIEDLKTMDTLHFIICKATEGAIAVDPDFGNNWSYIKTKGLIRGAYHFFHSEDPPIEQAELFLQTVKELRSIDMPPIVDVEEGSLKSKITPLQFDRTLLMFLKHVQTKTGRKPVIYSNTAFADAFLINDSLATYPLWLADYTKKGSPAIPGIWKEKGYVIWQKSSSYSVDSRKTDFDIFNGDGHSFAEFIRKN